MTAAPRKQAWYSSRYSWLLVDMTATRSPGLDAELVAQRVGQAEHPVTVLAERAAVGAVDDRIWPVGERVEAGQEQSVVDELLHGAAG